ncbi:DUF3597 domain-containing protein [Shinella curvata]|uniref:DUF3597 domain-containing protein n=1 Tax=Shinella curvata TaxID=1817964 RepID=A0ABT8XIK2_9HYPH|nr:DUF3597 domain-containing protein [Shinella curvata]MCJ8053658.1 DUF3597 domain-containing protein [Shinella curvata]MDO6122990.1 DUF3597 domain-containing protein [Shinella curvata]
MGIFSSIKEKLFGKAAQDAPVETASRETVTAEAVKPVTADVSATSTTSKESVATPAENKAAGAAPVDVAAIMDAAVKKNGQKLDWRRSIVDMMKALDLDSSLAARKELADELGYTGDKSDSATMNVWLHKALMKALAENGGKVPADLLD